MTAIVDDSVVRPTASFPTLDTAMIERAMRYPFEQVRKRYMQQEDVSETIAREHERELKRYLALCAANPSTNYGMKGPVDDLWHTFLLFTVDYAAFCDRVAGRFIHHVPASSSAPVDADDYEHFLRDYEVTFGEPAPAHVWPRFGRGGVGAESADCSFGNCGPSCSPSCGAQGCSNGG